MSLSAEKKSLVLLFVAYAVSKTWTLLPEQSSTHDFFPFYDIQLTTRTYAWILCSISQIVIIYWAIWPLFVKLRGEMFVICILYILDIPDYLIFYCEPLFYLGSLPVEYGLLKGIGILIITAISYFKE